MISAHAPLLVSLATACACALAGRTPRLQYALSLLGALALLATAALLVPALASVDALTAQAGNWPPPFAIAFVVDRLGAALILVAAVMLVAAIAWQASDYEAAPAGPGLHPLLHGFVAGCVGAFSTADLFNLYVWFELALICALGLLAMGGTRRALDATLRYYVLNVFGTLLLLVAIGLIYAATGHLQFAALSTALEGLADGTRAPLLGLLLVALLIKAAAFPFSAWLPASYPALPAPVLALFAALATKVGLCAILRVFGGVAAPAPAVLDELLGTLAMLSMVCGVLGAAWHWDMRRILAFHSVSQVGYILLAIALASPAGYRAAIWFIVHHSLVKSGLFLIAAMIMRHAGHHDLRRIGGLWLRRPALGGAFLFMACALVGIPPLSGFWGKYLIVAEALAAGRYAWAAVALLVSALTLYSMSKIWLEAFWKPHPDEIPPPATRAPRWPAHAGLALVMLLVLGVSLLPEVPLRQAGAAAVTLIGAGR